MGNKLLPLKQFKILFSYVLPPVLAIGATLVKIYFFLHTGYSIPFLLYFFVFLISGFLAGARAVTVAIAAVALCIFAWLIPLRDSVGRYSVAEMIIFFSEGSAVAMLFWWVERGMRKLDEREQKYRRIIDQGAEALFLCQADGRVSYASAAVSRLLQKERTAVSGLSLQEMIHPDDRPQFDLAWHRLQAKGEGTALLQQRMARNAGEWCWTECCVNNLIHDRLVTAMIVQVRDITRRVDQQRHQEDFVNMASHELKSPITAIRGFLQIAVKRWQEGKLDDHPKYLDRIQAQTDKLLSLIDDMLNMTRIRAGELIYHFERTDLSACVQEAVMAMRAAAPDRLIELDLPAALPLIQADSARLGQVVTNLLSNALKYSTDQAPVNVSVVQKDHALELKVSDHGIGIPADKLRRVFDRFYRVDTLPKGKYEGLGLGLFIAAEIIHKHKGEMQVSSEEGKGSVFGFSLPLNSQ